MFSSNTDLNRFSENTMEAQSQGGLGSLLDMDLEGLDFETAYELINEKAELWDDSNDQFHMNLVDDSQFFNHMTVVPENASTGGEQHTNTDEEVDKVVNRDRAFQEEKDTKPAASQITHSVPSSRPQTPRNHIPSPFGAFGEHSGNSHNEGLLSVNESHAIEHFLDSLLTTSPSKASNAALFSPKLAQNFMRNAEHLGADPHTYIFDHTELQTTISRHFQDKSTTKQGERLDTKIAIAASPSHEEKNNNVNSKDILKNDNGSKGKSATIEPMILPIFESYEQYKPIDPKIPIVEVPEHVIPEDISSDAAELRRWKHVYLEKQRRNTFKREYDELIGMIRYPRPVWTEVHKNLPKSKEIISLDYKLPKKEGKRITKHTLLNYIVQDIQLLLLANEELEQLCK